MGSELDPPVCDPKKLNDAAAGAALVEGLSVAALSLKVKVAPPTGAAAGAALVEDLPVAALCFKVNFFPFFFSTTPTGAAAGAALVEDLLVAALSAVVENTKLGATLNVAGVVVTLDTPPPNGCAATEAAPVEKLNAPDAALVLSPPPTPNVNSPPLPPPPTGAAAGAALVEDLSVAALSVVVEN